MTPTPPRILKRWAIQCRPRHRGAVPRIATLNARYDYRTRDAARREAKRFRGPGLAAQAVRVVVEIRVEG